MVFVDSKKLKDLMINVLSDREVNDLSADHVVASVIQTSLRGIDSHGINLFPHYCRAVDSGRINKQPNIKITASGDTTAIIDADHAFGHHAGAIAIDQAINKAKQSGMGSVSVSNTTHFGAAAYFALRAAEQDCLGFAFTNADGLVKVFGSSESFFGTNPICFTAPMAKEEPFCLDMATSLVSWNKIRNYADAKEDIPEHWAFDKEGKAVTDPSQAASLSPIGEYKGYGLGMMVDILCSVLAGGPISKDILAMYTAPIESRRMISHFFMVIDISKFISVDSFKSSLQQMVDRIRALQKTGSDDVMVAGDPEKKAYIERIKTGIPVPDTIFEAFKALSPKFGHVIK